MAKAVRNISRVEQYVIIENRRHAIGPHQIRVFEDAIANQFVARCHPFVIDEGGINAIDEDRPRGDRVWIYNLTGNPDVPKEIEIQQSVKGGRVERVKIPNPLAEGQPVHRMKGGGEETKTVHGELTSVRHPARELIVHPWTRKAFDKDDAQWMLQREANRAPHMQMLARSRAPGPNEPNETWGLHELIVYARIVDTNCPIVPNEATLEKWYADGYKDAISERLLVDVSHLPLQRVMAEAKNLMVRRLFYRVADVRYQLPTKEEFNQLAEQYLTDPDWLKAEKAPGARGPGRPRKDEEQRAAV